MPPGVITSRLTCRKGPEIADQRGSPSLADLAHVQHEAIGEIAHAIVVGRIPAHEHLRPFDLLVHGEPVAREKGLEREA